MTPPNLPETSWLAGRRARELTIGLIIPAMRIVSGVMAALLLALGFVRVPMTGLLAVFAAVGAAWTAVLVVLAVRFFRRPPEKDLAKRADRVFGFRDDLLALSEFPESEWRTATWERAQAALASGRHAWPSAFSKKHAAHLLAAVALTGAVLWITAAQTQREILIQTAAAQAQSERIRAVEEVVRDWEEFVKSTEDPELKKLFGEAALLREAVRDPEPMTAMLAMNRLEAKMASLGDTLAAQSLSPQAARMAEALEAFEGMGAASAALRNQNFEAAAREAEKLGAKLEKNPDGSSTLRRSAAVAEMLASESAAAQKRGNNQLSESLSQLSAAAKNCSNGTVPNRQICPALQSLREQFSKEAACKNSGRTLATGKSQLDSLRKQLRGEPCDGAPSLCKSQGNRPGGSKPGTGTDGQPLGDPTKLADAGLAEKATGTPGEGESEITTTSASTGSAATAGAATQTELAGYLELSEKAVADESLPLAHRRAIKRYFERIRPVAESQHP
jgi:hypothetical protein